MCTAAAQIYIHQGELTGSVHTEAESQGYSVALSTNGNTAVFGGPYDNGYSGGTWVFTRNSAGKWSQQGNELEGSGGVGQGEQGTSVALSADGNTALVGGPYDNSNVGAVWVFTRNSAGKWSQQGSKLVGTGAVGAAQQGKSVALSADGNTAVIGGPADDISAFTNPVGAVWVFTRNSSGKWTQQGKKLVGSGFVLSPTGVGQGSSVTVSADGDTALEGGPGDTGNIGAAWAFKRDSSGDWSQQGSKLVGTGFVLPSAQGYSVSVSADGNTALIGAPSDNRSVGAVWVFTRNSADKWSQHGSKLAGSGWAGQDVQQGFSAAISGDGTTALIDSPYDDYGVGAMWVFTRGENGDWSQEGSKIVAHGSAVALSYAGTTALLGDGGQNAVWPFVRAAPEALGFVPVTPCRVVDTRGAESELGGPEVAAGSSRAFPIPAGPCGIPSNAAAYSLNLTVVPDAQLGYLTVWPTGQDQPPVSVLNSDGRVKANATIMPAGTNGSVNVYASNSTQLLIDIDGYFVAAGSSTLAFYPLTPCRVADTRKGTGPLGGPFIKGGAAGREFPVMSSSCSIPSSARAYSLNLTAVPHGPLGYLTVWPTSEAQPSISTLNAPTGAVTANAAIVPAGPSGEISVYASNDTDLAIDVNGYFAASGPGGLSLYTQTPCRVLDTRTSSGDFSGKMAVNVTASDCGALISTAQAFVLNATVIPVSSLGYLTLWPNGDPQPDVSTLNASDGAITSNPPIVATTNGSIDAFASNSTQLVLDISGFFAP